MSLNFNRRGELEENTVITNEGVIFIKEKKYSPSEMRIIRKAEGILNELEDYYGTLNPFELMDDHIKPRELLDYMTARYNLHRLGWTGEEDVEL